MNPLYYHMFIEPRISDTPGFEFLMLLFFGGVACGVLIVLVGYVLDRLRKYARNKRRK